MIANSNNLFKIIHLKYGFNLIIKRYRNPKTTEIEENNYSKILNKYSNKINELTVLQNKPVSKFKKKYPKHCHSLNSEYCEKKKLKILNQTYLIQISEIISNLDNDEFTNINITNVETSNDLKNINVFWNYFGQESKFRLDDIYELLEKNKMKIIEDLKYTCFMNSVPTINFFYDAYEDTLQKMNKIFENLNIGVKKQHFNPENFFSQSELFGSPRYKLNLTETNLSTKLKDIKKESMDFVQIENINFQCPHDMKLNMFNLDYKSLINKVLFQVNLKSRTGSKKISENNNYPSIWVSSILNNNDVIQSENEQIDTRLDNMKEFSKNYRRKKLRESKEAKSKMYDKLFSHSDRLVEAKKRYDLYDADKFIFNKIKNTDDSN